MRHSKAILHLLLFLAPVSSFADQKAPVTARVIHVFDGDTLLATVDGKEEKIRLLGIDAPETDGPYTTLEPFGIEASKKLRSLTKGKVVTLLFGGSTLRDRYGRLLAHVILPDGRIANEVMLKEGYAEFYRRYSYTRKERYQKLEAEAKKSRRGMWAKNRARKKTGSDK